MNLYLTTGTDWPPLPLPSSGDAPPARSELKSVPELGVRTVERWRSSRRRGPGTELLVERER